MRITTGHRWIGGVILLCAWLNLSCAPDGISAQVTPTEQKELTTLKGQIVDPGRQHRTKFEAARLLLEKRTEPARAILADVLRDASQPGARIAVAEAIAEDSPTDKRFVEPLLEMLQGEHQPSRQPAARALAAYENASVRGRLSRLVKNTQTPLEVRLVLIEALQRDASRQTVRDLIDLLRDPSLAIRDAAAQGLRTLVNLPDFGADVSLWEQWWAENQFKTREQWLADLVDRMAVDRIRLDAENEQLRVRLVQAMQDVYNIATKAQRPVLVQTMLSDPVADVRILGASLVDRMIAANDEIPADLRSRIRALLRDEDPRVRREAALLEAELPVETSAAVLLQRLAREDSPLVRAGIITALGRLAAPEAISAVLHSLAKGELEEATPAAEALAKIVAAAPLEDESRNQAALVLVQRYKQADSDTRAEEILREALLRAMGALGDSMVTPVLVDALDDKAGVVRLAAINALLSLRAETAAEHIAPLISDSDRGVRQAAITALARLGGGEYISSILNRTAAEVESDTAVRKQAWEQVLLLAKQASADTLAEVIGWLADNKAPLEQQIEIMRLRTAALRDAQSPALAEALWRHGKTLTRAGRSDEARTVLQEALTLYRRRGEAASAETLGEMWLSVVDAMLVGNDPAVATMLQAQTDTDLLVRAFAMFRNRLDYLRHQENYLPILVMGQAMSTTDVPERVGKQGHPNGTWLAEILQLAQAEQDRKDEKQVGEWLDLLLTGEQADRSAAEEQIKAMGDRAVRPLLNQLRTEITAETPNAAREKAIIDLLKQVAPKLNDYDPQASAAEKVKRIDAWMNSL